MGKKPGPKPGYTTELIVNIAEYRAKGMNRSEISRRLMIPDSTIEGWEKRPEFREVFAKRSLEIAGKQIDKVLNAEDISAQAARWWLERQLKDDFMPPTQRQEVTFTLSAAWEKATDEEKRELIEKLEGELEVEG